MPNVPEQRERAAEHAVTPLELFFDLVFVFGLTQVTTLMSKDPTWHGVVRGMLALGALWLAWNGYTWLSSALDVDEGGVRLALLAAMAAMLVAALAVPLSFASDALLFALAYLVVRLVHLMLSGFVVRGDADRWGAIVRYAPSAVACSALLLAAAFAGGGARVALWIAGLAIDYLGPVVIGMGRGWHVSPAHFAERYGLIVLIALGESIVAIGVGAGFVLGTEVVLAALLGVVVIAALWWLYFDVAAILARRRLADATGLARARLARDAYNYLHLPMVAGVVLFALGLKFTLRHPGAELEQVPAVALCGGVALYLLAHIAFLFRATGYVFRRRTVATIVLVALIPAATVVPALAALALVAAAGASLVAYEAIRHREARARLRHPVVD